LFEGSEGIATSIWVESVYSLGGLSTAELVLLANRCCVQGILYPKPLEGGGKQGEVPLDARITFDSRVIGSRVAGFGGVSAR
jgi:hypothetical protein